MKTPLYLDCAATTPVDPRVARRMIPFLTEDFGNAASRSHAFGWNAAAAVSTARGHVAALVNCDPSEIVWTSGATESINLALKGAAHANAGAGRHLVTVRTEHHATLDAMRKLEREGYAVTRLDVCSNGLVDLAAFRRALRPDTTLVSVMAVNNEIGVVQDLAAIGALCRARGILFHVDAAQAAGKIPLDVGAAGADLMSLSAHKAYGPKGVGALYVRRKPRIRIEAQMHGGGHERGLRSGTLATHQIVGMGEAFRIAAVEMAEENARIRRLAGRLRAGLLEIAGVSIHGDLERRVPHNLNVCFADVDAGNLSLALDDIAVSTGSACASDSLEPSHVLRALGAGDVAAHGSVRISIGRFTTAEEIDYAIDRFRCEVAQLRTPAPQTPRATEDAVRRRSAEST